MKVGIIGGGACGVITALTIKKNSPNINVTILEQNDRILKKLLKTGNGKCNIANNIITSEMYNDYSLIDDNSDINVIKELMDYGLVLKETTLGRVYPYSEQAKSVVNVLLRDLEKYDVEICTNYLVEKITIKDSKYIINGDKEFDYLVIASGSIAQEKTNGYDLLKNLNHHITPLRPALVPIKVKEKVDHLQGLRIKCKATLNGRVLDGEILFKNEYSEEEINNLLTGTKKEEVLEGIFAKMIVKEILSRGNNTSYIIKHLTFTISGFYGFNDGQIVRGGLKLDEISNYESAIHSNLFIGGEVLDVDGASGGYNLYFAWLSGIVIGNNIVKREENK